MTSPRTRALVIAVAAVVALWVTAGPFAGSGHAQVGEVPRRPTPTLPPQATTTTTRLPSAPGLPTLPRPTTSTSSTSSTTSTTSSTTSTTSTTTTTVPSGEEPPADTNAGGGGADLSDPLGLIDASIGPVGAGLVDLPLDGPVLLPSGSRSTRKVLGLLGLTGSESEEIARWVAPFPVAGLAAYSDDWAAPRFSPVFHLHEGTDIFAARGTPVIASDNGVIQRLGIATAVGGNAVHLTASDGTAYYYAHLDRFALGLRPGQRVAQGQVIGYVGTTGNAEGTSPHLHFEIHPRGGPAVPPVPLLDHWLAEAEQRAHGYAPARALAAPALPAPDVIRAAPAGAARPRPGPRLRIIDRAAASSPAQGSVGDVLYWVPLLIATGLWWSHRRRSAGTPPGVVAAVPLIIRPKH